MWAAKTKHICNSELSWVTSLGANNWIGPSHKALLLIKKKKKSLNIREQYLADPFYFEEKLFVHYVQDFQIKVITSWEQ